jgi:hypothetical protein
MKLESGEGFAIVLGMVLALLFTFCAGDPDHVHTNCLNCSDALKRMEDSK